MRDKVIAGIDIGGTNTVFGFVAEDGEILAKSRIDTICHGTFDEYVAALCEAVDALKRLACPDCELVAVGAGAPCANSETGMIESAAQFPWKTNLPLRDMLTAHFGVPVAVANDANAATVGEMVYGSAKGLDNFIILTLGTSVGSGIVADGRLIGGHRSMAGELGHTIIRPGGRPCCCGRRGCLETYCSATGVVRTALEFLSERSDDSMLRRHDADALTSKEVYDAAMAGDALAKEVFDFTGRVLGEACADFVASTAPQSIIFFGGLSKAGDLLMKPLQEEFERNLLFVYAGHVDLRLSSLPESDAALLGAAAVANQIL